MKLFEFIDDEIVLYESVLGGENLKIFIRPVEDGVDQLFIESKSKDPLNIKMSHGLAANVMNKYYANRTRSVRLYAKTIDERNLYKKLVDDMLKTGKYKKLRQVWVNGGLMYDLERLK